MRWHEEEKDANSENSRTLRRDAGVRKGSSLWLDVDADGRNRASTGSTRTQAHA